jgi:F0F1-type ATP synthase membrane subunit b/b'
MPAKRKNTRKKSSSKKRANPSLNLVLKRLDEFDQRFDALDRKIDAVDQKVDAVRQETAAGINAVRGEMAQGFDSLRQEFKAELQKEFEKHGAGIYQHISRVETELKAETAELRSEHRQLLTGMDAMVKNYENYTHDRAISDAKLHDLQRDVETLKKKDMEKAAAIDKIEKEVDKLKAA